MAAAVHASSTATSSVAERLTNDLEDWARGIGDRIRTLGARRKGWAQVASLGVNVVGTSAVLAVSFPANDGPQQLLLLDSVRTWDLVFPHADTFNAWAEERYVKLHAALMAITVQPQAACAISA